LFDEFKGVGVGIFRSIIYIFRYNFTIVDIKIQE
jgi:hypothetical protein